MSYTTNIKTEIQTTIMDNKCRYETVVDKTCVFLNMTHKDIITKIKDEVLHTYPPDGINIVIYDDTDYAVQLTSSFNEIQTLDGALINLNGMSIINLNKLPVIHSEKFEEKRQRHYNLEYKGYPFMKK